MFKRVLFCVNSLNAKFQFKSSYIFTFVKLVVKYNNEKEEEIKRS
jgi:hypothetical protein